MTNKETRFSAWMRNGRLSFLCWLLVLCAYVALRFAGIADDVVTNTLIAFTGVLVGNLGIAQGIRSARTEERTYRTARKVDNLEQFAAEAHPDKAGPSNDE